jgi:hypothetical protein
MTLTNDQSTRDILKRLTHDERRSLEAAILLALPVAILKYGPLTISVIHSALERRGIGIRCGVDDRPLRGCLVAFGDHGIIFVDGTDPEEEQRFTLAHEAAHFVADYLEPRERAQVALGTSAREILDGRRAATNDERIYGFLSGVRVGPHVHQMARDTDFSAIDELKADALAFELLAPSATVRALVTQLHRWDHREAAFELLTGRFGLPSSPARLYARLLYVDPDAKPLRTQFGL